MESSHLEVLAWRLFEESNDAIFVLQPVNATIQEANPAAQKLTGLRYRQLRDRNLKDLIRGQGGDGFDRLLSAVRETAFFHSQEEYVLYRHQLDPLPVNVSVSRIHAVSGPLGLLVVRDISDRKHAETNLRRFNAALERKVRDKTQKLQASNEQLRQEIREREQAELNLKHTNERLRQSILQLERAQHEAVQRERLRALEQVAGGIAHDINNSLSAVSAFSELILKNARDDDTREWARQVSNAAGDITGTVRRLRQFYGDPVGETTKEAIDVLRLVQDVVTMTRPKWHDDALRRQKEISIGVQASAEPIIYGDPAALRSVLVNIIFNAVDAIPTKGQIRAAVGQENDLAVIEIHDDGEGMNHEQTLRCLEPFYSTKKDGSGLGLSVSHGIVRHHHGQLDIESEPAAGTTVRLRFPVIDGDSTAASPRTATAQARGDITAVLRGKRVLYVDDDDAARLSINALLSSLGMVVETASNGLRGIEVFRSGAFDAVITDLSMPGLNGRQLAAAIKQQQPTLPVIAVSGWLSEDATVVDDPEPDHMLSKPLTIDQLTETLIRLLSHSGD